MTTIPQHLDLSFEPTTSVGSIVVSQLRGIYRGTESIRDVLVWTGTATVTGSSGLFSANLTDDGTTTGNAVFSEVLSAHANHILNTTTASSASFAILRGYTAGLKTAAFMGVRSNTFASPSGSVFQVTVIGLPV